MDDWKTKLTTVLEDVQQRDQKAAADTQRVAALVDKYLIETIYPALQEFKEAIAPYDHAATITPDESNGDDDRPYKAVRRTVHMRVDSGDFRGIGRELEVRIVVLGKANPDRVEVEVTETILSVVPRQNGESYIETDTERLQLLNKDNSHEPPTQGGILGYVVHLFERGANHSRG